MKIHPFAARFPMIPPEEIQAMADDIETNGQIHELVVWKKTGELLDGRNRLAACQLLKITPKTREWSGENPEAFIVSANVHRRHIPKGTQAMAVALAYPEAHHGGKRTKGQKKQVEPLNLTKDLLSRARTVIREFGQDSDVVDQVMKTDLSLDEAYDRAVYQREARSFRKRQLEELRKEFPEFASNVDDGIWSMQIALQQADSEREFQNGVASSGEKQLMTREQITDIISRTGEIADKYLGEESVDTTKYDVPMDLGKTIDRMESRIPPYLDDQQEITGKLLGVIRTLESLSKKSIPPSNAVEQSFYAGVLSGIGQIIELSKQIGDAYLTELGRQDHKIRKIK